MDYRPPVMLAQGAAVIFAAGVADYVLSVHNGFATAAIGVAFAGALTFWHITLEQRRADRALDDIIDAQNEDAEQ